VIRGAPRGLVAALLTVLCATCAASGAGAGPANAQPGEEPAGRPAVRFVLDNDEFDFWIPPDLRPDFGYSHGTLIDVDFSGAPRWLSRSVPDVLVGPGPQGESPAFALRARQLIFGPWELPPDRPYAGWLEVAAGLTRRTARSRRELLLHVGVTGPPSLAGRIQDYVHHHFEKGPAPDWSTQLPAEPGIGIEWNAASQVVGVGRQGGLQWRLGPGTRWRLGTFAADLRLSVETSLGLNPPAAWGGPIPRSRAFSLYALAAPKVDFIARDEFLDGTVFRSSVSVNSNPVVPESEIGVGLGWYGVRAEWRVMRRGKEFENQPDPHSYGSIQLSWNP
jgi:hypothetical protein